MSDASSASSSDEAPNGRLARTARTAAALARRLRGGVAVTAALSAGAGLFLWVLLWWPPSTRLGALFGAATTLVLLLGPAAVLGLFYQGLTDLLALPDRLSERTTRTVEQSTEAARSVAGSNATGFFGRLWGLVKQTWALRSVLLENRALLLRYGALLRFATPGFLLLVVLAAGFSLLLIPLAIIAGVIALLW
jgi:hypothetical protein